MYLGIDVGGSNIRVGAFAKPDKLLKLSSFKVDQNFESSMAKIFKEAKRLSGGKTIDGVGIGVPGSGIDTKKGIIKSSAHLSGWIGKPLKRRVEQKLKTKVIMAHDVVCAALGEAQSGHGKNLDRFTFIGWGTGVGAATVEKIESKLKVTQIEAGHQIIKWNGRKCHCGQNGCLEAYIGGKSATDLYGKELSQIKDDKIWEEIAQNAAQGILNMSVINHSDLIVIGGGVAAKQKHLLPRIARILKNRQKVFKIPRLKLSKKGENTHLYGCVNLLFTNII